MGSGTSSRTPEGMSDMACRDYYEERCQGCKGVRCMYWEDCRGVECTNGRGKHRADETHGKLIILSQDVVA
jgi:hypothetical protein